jgi:hypothetical protein
MKQIINTLQQFQSCALDRGISFDLDVTINPEETKARVAIHSTATGIVDEQRYMKATISSDNDEQYVSDVLSCISSFIDQISTSPIYNQKEEE